MGELIFGFMVHHAYWETAAAVARDMLAGTVHVQPKDIQEVSLQKHPPYQSTLHKLHWTALQLHPCTPRSLRKDIELISDCITTIWRVSLY